VLGFIYGPQNAVRFVVLVMSSASQGSGDAAPHARGPLAPQRIYQLPQLLHDCGAHQRSGDVSLDVQPTRLTLACRSASQQQPTAPKGSSLIQRGATHSNAVAAAAAALLHECLL
jgi:hypothetical protein